MDFDELLDVLRSFVGKPVDVGVDLASSGDDLFSLASFSGIVDRVDEGHAPRGAATNIWRAWFERDPRAPSSAVVTLDPRLYLDANFSADRHDDEERVDSDVGMTWTLRINLIPARVEILVYV